jgi:hypothetical protein
MSDRAISSPALLSGRDHSISLIELDDETIVASPAALKRKFFDHATLVDCELFLYQIVGHTVVPDPLNFISSLIGNVRIKIAVRFERRIDFSELLDLVDASMLSDVKFWSSRGDFDGLRTSAQASTTFDEVARCLRRHHFRVQPDQRVE